MNLLKDRMRLALQESGKDQSELSRAAGITSVAVNNWCTGAVKSIRSDTLLKVAKALGVTPEWLASGMGPMNVKAQQQEDSFPRIPREEDYFLIPIFSTYGACGNGFLNDNIEVTGEKAFRKEQIKKLDVDPSLACVIHAAGDSMYPYIADGDEVLIDKRVAPTRTGEIYAVMIDGEVFIKRLAREFGSLFLRSDNPNKSMYPDMHVPKDHDLTIIGRVVWRGGGI